MRIKMQTPAERRARRGGVDERGRWRDQQRERKSSGAEPPEATPSLPSSSGVLPWQHDVPHQHERTFWAPCVTGGRNTHHNRIRIRIRIRIHAHADTHTPTAGHTAADFGGAGGEERTDLLMKSLFYGT